MHIVSLFCEIHDFFLKSEAHISKHCLPSEAGTETRGCPRRLHPSEVMTMLIAYQLLEKKPALNLDGLQESSDLPLLF